MKEFIVNYVNEYFEGMIHDLKEFASIPAPSHHEEKRSAWLLTYMKNHLHIEAVLDEVGNVTYLYGKSDKKPLHCVLAHIDVVFDDLEELSIIEKDGLLIGGGVGDDSANVIASLYLLRFLLQYKIELPYQLLFVFNVGEEGLGNLKGSKQILKDYPHIIEMTALDLESNRCVVKGVGSLRYEINVYTKGGHSYNDYGNASAIVEASKLVMQLDAFPIGNRGKSTKNIGLMHGGTSINTIANHCQIYFEMRSDDALDLEEMNTVFLQIMEDAKKQGLHIEFILVGDRPCGRVNEEMMKPLMDKLIKVHEEFEEEQPHFMSGSTDCNPFLHANIPAICFGCYEGDGAHTKEEWLNIKSMRKGVAMIIAYFLK